MLSSYFFLAILAFSSQELGKWLFIAPLQSKTHMWTSTTMLTFLEFMAEELRARRRALNLDLSAKAMIVCDMAPQHSAKKFAALKQAWMDQHNAVPSFHNGIFPYIYSLFIIQLCQCLLFVARRDQMWMPRSSFVVIVNSWRFREAGEPQAAPTTDGTSSCIS